MSSTCAQTNARSSASVAEPSPKRPGERVGHRRPARRPLVEAERDPAGVPEQQRRDDPGDHGQDQVGLAEVAALEARGPLELADRHRGEHAGQHEHGEDVHEQREPALVAEPRQRGVAVHRADHRDHDRGEEDEEAPEDRGVHQARDRAAGRACAGRARSRPRCGRAAAGRRSAPTACPSARGRRSASPGGRTGRRRRRAPPRARALRPGRLWRARLSQLRGDRRARSRSGPRSRRSRRSRGSAPRRRS